MPRTYNAATPTAKDRVRERIGDADPTRFALDDEKIIAALSECGGSVETAAVRCARDLRAWMVRNVDRSIGGMTITRSNISLYDEVVAQLEREAAAAGAQMYAGGISIAESDALKSDADWRPHTFSVGGFDRDQGGGLG